MLLEISSLMPMQAFMHPGFISIMQYTNTNQFQIGYISYWFGQNHIH